jgi:hypothetical protein
LQRASLVDPHKAKIDTIRARHPDLSAVRIQQEIARGPDGYDGSACTLRRYLSVAAKTEPLSRPD